jgi:hypothetical protein
LSNDIGGSKASSGGAMLGLGAGVRLITITLGARVRMHPHSDFTLWQINAEAGWHIPLGSWDPYVSVHGGYVTAAVKDAPSDFPSPHGFNLGAAGGADYYLSPLFSVGLEVSATAMFLSRGSYSIVPEASGTGAVLSGSALAGLHFDL